MTNLETALAGLVSKHAADARGAMLLSLAGVLLNEPQPQVRVAPRPDMPRFINLNANGRPTEADHVAVYQTATDLIWTAAPIGTDLEQPAAMKAAADCTLLGASGWRGPEQLELLSILDFEFWDPCVNQKHFKGPYGFTWSSTPYKGSKGAFRGVYLAYGNSYWSGQGVRDHALAVLAGQQLGLRL